MEHSKMWNKQALTGKTDSIRCNADEDAQRVNTPMKQERQEVSFPSLFFQLYRAIRRYLSRFLRACAKLLSTLPKLLRITEVLIERLFHRSDYRRWTKLENLETWWEPRTKKIAEFIPRDSRVIEFGSGSRPLARYLDSSCTYFPSDLVYRGPGTIICDLNKKPLPDVKSTLNPDVAVFAGVLEYVRDLPAVIEWLSHQATVCVASYTCAESAPGTIHRLVEVFQRSYYGYVNEYREEEILALFQTHGFVCVKKDRWTSQLIFLFALSAQSVISVL